MEDDTEKVIHRCAAQVLCHPEGDDVDWFPLDKIAISVFDGWLGPKNYHLLDCKDDAEREDRNRRMLSFWMKIYDSYEVLCRVNDCEFERETNRLKYESSCAYDGNRPGNRFQCILIPELTAIYHENWDDTNVLWYSNRNDIEPLISMAIESGLYSIEYA